jgi:hypothetical protein
MNESQVLLRSPAIYPISRRLLRPRVHAPSKERANLQKDERSRPTTHSVGNSNGSLFHRYGDRGNYAVLVKAIKARVALDVKRIRCCVVLEAGAQSVQLEMVIVRRDVVTAVQIDIQITVIL